MEIPYVKSPCKNCPFRKDSLKGWLGEERMADIIGSSTFPCHKTVEGLGYNGSGEELQCAGHMMLARPTNIYMHYANITQQALDLRNKELVFDTVEDCIDHHKN